MTPREDEDERREDDGEERDVAPRRPRRGKASAPA